MLVRPGQDVLDRLPEPGFRRDALRAHGGAQKFGTDHEEFIVEPNAIEILPTLAWHYDQPFADSSALPTYYVSRLTRQHVTVALNGDGGDEWFGGYERYRALLVRGLYQAATTPALRDIASQIARFIPTASRRAAASTSCKFFADAARGTLDEFNLRMFNHRQFEAAERAALYAPDFAARLGPANADRYFLDLMIDSATDAGDDPVDRALRTDTLMYLPDTLLVKVDIASMAVALEGRSPLLDTSIMEFAASLPRAWKVTARQSKKILKDAHRGILPRRDPRPAQDGLQRSARSTGCATICTATRARSCSTGRVSAAATSRARRSKRLIEDHRAGRRNNAVEALGAPDAGTLAPGDSRARYRCDVLKQLRKPSHDQRLGELSDRRLTRLRAKTRGQLRIVEQRAQLPRQVGGILWIREQPVLAVDDAVAHAADARGDDGQPRRHRFDERVAERLVVRRLHVRIRRAQQPRASLPTRPERSPSAACPSTRRSAARPARR